MNTYGTSAELTELPRVGVNCAVLTRHCAVRIKQITAGADEEMTDDVERLTGLSGILGVGGGAVARMGDRCFVHPHGYVNSASSPGPDVVDGDVSAASRDVCCQD